VIPTRFGAPPRLLNADSVILAYDAARIRGQHLDVCLLVRGAGFCLSRLAILANGIHTRCCRSTGRLVLLCPDGRSVLGIANQIPSSEATTQEAMDATADGANRVFSVVLGWLVYGIYVALWFAIYTGIRGAIVLVRRWTTRLSV